MAVRRVRLEVRLDEAVISAWRAAAISAGLSVSELVRCRVNGALLAGAPRRLLDAGKTGQVGGPWREVFLDALQVGRSVAAACRAAGVSRTLVYRARGRSREFAVAWELALEVAEAGVEERLAVAGMSADQGLGRSPIVAGRQFAVARSRKRARLQVRLEPAELEAWRAAAAEVGLPVSGLVRRLVDEPVPVPAAAGRPSTPWRPSFIHALRHTGLVAEACRTAGVSRTLAYQERDRSPAFATAWQEADAEVEDRARALLYEMGVLGVPIVKRRVKTRADGSIVEIVTESRRYSDKALIELMRRLDPERYGHKPRKEPRHPRR